MTFPVAWFGRDSIFVLRPLVANTIRFTADLTDMWCSGGNPFDPTRDSVTVEGLNWDGLGTLVSGVRRLAVISPLQRTTITFSLPSNQNVSLKIYNIMGEVVATLIDGFHKAGSFDVEFNASNLASGIYFYTLQSDNFSSTRKKIFVK